MAEFTAKCPICGGPMDERNKYCSKGCYETDNPDAK